MSRIAEKAAEHPILADIQKMRAVIYQRVAHLADQSGITPGALVMLLKEISEDVYTAGIDKALAQAGLTDFDNIADAFDAAWLSPLAIRLNNYTPNMKNGAIPNGHKLIRRASWRRRNPKGENR